MTLTVTQFAKRAGVSASTVRFYEKEGLLPPAKREFNRRVYSEQDLSPLRLVVNARRFGFSVAQIRSVMAGQTFGSSMLKKDLAEMVRARQLSIENQIAELTKQAELLRRAQSCGCLGTEKCDLVVSA